MASDYTDSFAGDPYFIHKGEQLSAAGMNAALNTKEKVANKVTTIDSNSTDAHYPSAKAVYSALNTKEEKTNKKDTIGNSSTEYPSSKAVTVALANKVDASDLIALQTTVSGLETTVGGLQKALPIGTILMYDGGGWLDNVTLPGWYCCDKANHNKNAAIPNLEDLFIKGKGSETQPGTNWLQLTTANLPSHTHDGSTSSNGDHGHNFRFIHIGGSKDSGTGDYLAGTEGQGQYLGSGNGDGRVCYASYSVTKDYSGHGHSITIKATGSDTAFNNMPAYYALIYIKRIQ
jgi:hypothetical protein